MSTYATSTAPNAFYPSSTILQNQLESCSLPNLPSVFSPCVLSRVRLTSRKDLIGVLLSFLILFLTLIIFQSLFLLAVLVFQGCHDKVAQTGWIKQQEIIVSQFWRPEVQTQGVGGAMLLLKTTGENPSLPLPSRWLLGIFRVLWLVALSLQSLPSSSHDLLLVSRCLYDYLLMRTLVILD